MRQVGGPSVSAQACDQGCKRVQTAKIGGESGRFSALALDLRNQGQGVGRGGAVMDADPPAASREIERNGPAEPSARAGHEHGPGILVLRHAISLERCRRIELPSEILRPTATLSEHPSRNKGGRESLQME